MKNLHSCKIVSGKIFFFLRALKGRWEIKLMSGPVSTAFDFEENSFVLAGHIRCIS